MMRPESPCAGPLHSWGPGTVRALQGQRGKVREYQGASAPKGSNTRIVPALRPLAGRMRGGGPPHFGPDQSSPVRRRGERSVIGPFAPQIVRTLQAPYPGPGRAGIGLFLGVAALAVLRPVPAPAFLYHVITEIGAAHRAGRNQTIPAVRIRHSAGDGPLPYEIRQRKSSLLVDIHRSATRAAFRCVIARQANALAMYFNRVAIHDRRDTGSRVGTGMRSVSLALRGTGCQEGRQKDRDQNARSIRHDARLDALFPSASPLSGTWTVGRCPFRALNSPWERANMTAAMEAGIWADGTVTKAAIMCLHRLRSGSG